VAHREEIPNAPATAAAKEQQSRKNCHIKPVSHPMTRFEYYKATDGRQRLAYKHY